jgi:ABC-type amino acid transport substrate-binding protein
MSFRTHPTGWTLLLLLTCLSALAGTPDTPSERPLRIHTVPIVNQDHFLARLLATQAVAEAIDAPGGAQITAHHGDAVIAAAREGRADLIITHVDFAGSQLLLREGLLGAGQVVFANPVALIGPVADPAGVAKARTIEAAQAAIRNTGSCLRPNALTHLAQFNSASLQCSSSDAGVTGLGAVLAAMRDGQYLWWGLHPFLMAEGALGAQGRAFVLPDPRVLRPLMAWPVSKGDAVRAQQVIEALRTPQTQAAIAAFRRESSPELQVWWPAAALDRLQAMENRGHVIVAVKNNAARAAETHRDPAHEAKRAFEVRLAQALARVLPGDPEALELRVLRKVQRLPAVAGGDVDLGISMFRPADGARRLTGFSRPYHHDGLAMLYRRGEAQPEPASAVLLGLAKDQEDWREDLWTLGLDPAGVSTVQSVEEAASRVANRAADAFIAPRVNLKVWLDYRKEATALQVSPILVPHEFAVALPLDNPRLKQRVDAEIARLEATGTLARWREDLGL